MSNEFFLCVIAGFAAQMIDGALGMAYGVTASSLLLGYGFPPAVVSATVHMAEFFTTGASAISHRALGNVNPALFRRLLIPGVLGAVTGACILTRLPGERLKPYVSAYLLAVGVVILIKAFRTFPPKEVSTHLRPLGFFGALVDALGGGGWGPIVTSNLIVRGNDIRQTIGSVNAAEFFITGAASATFILTIGIGHWIPVAGLALGGVLAAPLGALVCRSVPLKPFMVTVGIVIVGLSTRTLLKHFDLV